MWRDTISVEEGGHSPCGWGSRFIKEKEPDNSSGPGFDTSEQRLQCLHQKHDSYGPANVTEW